MVRDDNFYMPEIICIKLIQDFIRKTAGFLGKENICINALIIMNYW